MMNLDQDNNPVNILAFSGSTRAQSLNTALLSIVASKISSAGGNVNVNQINLDDFEMPIFNVDLEARVGLPNSVERLQELIFCSNGIIVACPEYNGSITPLLKNSLDWCSRSSRTEYKPSVFWSMPALIVGASISPFGALRAAGHLRGILNKLGALVLPGELLVPHADKVIANGTLDDDKTLAVLSEMSDTFVQIVAQLAKGRESV
jgi:chromate reductase, NAD(P)H dehydrogenase (quinone)